MLSLFKQTANVRESTCLYLHRMLITKVCDCAALRVLFHELFLETLENVEHLLEQFGLRQDGSAEMVRARLLAETGARHDADACATNTVTIIHNTKHTQH